MNIEIIENLSGDDNSDLIDKYVYNKLTGKLYFVFYSEYHGEIDWLIFKDEDFVRHVLKSTRLDMKHDTNYCLSKECLYFINT